MDQQQKYLDSRLDKLDKRDELIEQNMKESQETQKLLLEVQEERKQCKGFMRWFSKD